MTSSGREMDPRQGPKINVHKITSTHLTRKLALKFIAHVFVVGHHTPHIHLASMSRDKCSQAFHVSMSPTLSRSTVLQHVKLDVLKMCDGIFLFGTATHTTYSGNPL